MKSVGTQMKRLAYTFALGLLVLVEAHPACASVARFRYYWQGKPLPLQSRVLV